MKTENTTDNEEFRRALKQAGPLPENWESCSKTQLQFLAEHGAYGQRLTAKRYLKETKDSK